MTRIKICGIKTEEHALAAVEAGADYIGLVFTESRRRITPAQANRIISAVKQGARHVPEFVGVFVNTPEYVVNRVAEFCRLDYAQLSGDENAEYFRELKPSFFKAIKIGRHHEPEQILKELTKWSEYFSGREFVFLLDTFDPLKYGGTGHRLNWDIVKTIAEKFDVMVAGGLSPDNVAELIKKAKPWGVDVSSGVETDGEKDTNKIRAFIKAVKETDGDNMYQGASGK
jgi:phosphoribosylanthranilate isomerase